MLYNYIKEMEQTYLCRKCEEQKTISQFTFKVRRSYLCISCKAESYKENHSRYNKSDKGKARDKKAYSTPRGKMISKLRRHNRRVKQLGDTKNQGTSIELGCSYTMFSQYINYCCVMDNKVYRDCELDHIEPISKGGKNHWTNIYPLLSRINHKKGIKKADKEYTDKIERRQQGFKKLYGY